MLRLVLPVALLAAAPAAAQTPVQIVPPLTGTRLQVSATGEARRTPDLATVGAGVVTQAATASQAMADNARAMTATLAALRRAGIADKDVQTDRLSLQPQYRFGDNRPPQLTGYQATNRVSVRLHDLARAGTTVDALVAAGANQIDGPNLELEKPEAALDEARGDALAKARARAELYARAAGMHVARIVEISEGGGEYAPPVPMMALAKREVAAAPTPIAAGESRLTATLTAVFELR